MDYNDCDNDCDINDLLSDESFRKWVLDPNTESSVFWENWQKQNSGRKAVVKQARIVLKSFQFNESKLSQKESDLLLKRIKDTNTSRESRKPRETIVRPINDHIREIQQKRRKAPMGYMLRYAAILGGAMILAMSVHLILRKFDKEAEFQLVEKSNDRGQKATIFLSDGSVVTLNAESKLVYPQEFTEDIRKVHLTGEAFFEVAKGSKPFIVKATNIKAKVLGTSFNVKAFPDNKESSVALVTGKVMVSPPDSGKKLLILEPGEKGSIDRELGTLVKTKFDYSQEVAWKDGVLVFKDLPLGEAFRQMEQWYGVEFKLDQMPGKDEDRVTGKFDNESLDNVLHSIGFTVRFDHQIIGNKVYIKSKK